MSERPTFGEYGKDFQEKILQALLTDSTWAEQMAEVIDVGYFELKYLSYLAEKYFAYAKKYKVFPTMRLLITIIKDELRVGNDAVLKEQIVQYLAKIRSNPDVGDLPYIKEKSLDFCKRQALKVALEQAVDQIAGEKYELIVETIKKAVSVGSPVSLGHDFQDDFEARFQKINRNVVPTGIECLDAKEILQGGLGAGEIGIVVANSGVGKCSIPSTLICIKYVAKKINGKLYKPWDKINTKRGVIYARDIVSTDELI